MQGKVPWEGPRDASKNLYLLEEKRSNINMETQQNFLRDTSLVIDDLALITMMIYQYAYEPWKVFVLKR